MSINHTPEKHGASGGVLEPILEKPKGMHWKTFGRFVKEEELGAFTQANISYVTFLGDTTSVIMNHCEDGSTLSGQSMEINASTNLCSLEGGCCGDPRWNDEVCSVDIQ